MKPDVTLVSLAFNRRENVRELLTSLHYQSYPSFEVILVDNASSDGTVEMVRSDFPEVELIESGSNLGMVAYNLGFEAARGDYILVMDDDGLPGSDDWIAQVVARFEANPQLGVVSCTLRMRDTGRLGHDSPQFVPKGDEQLGYPGVAFNGTGAGLRAEALHAVGYYPVYFFRTYLELHLCTRLIEAGWTVSHFPSIEVWHSRPSRSSFRPGMYHGLRNYYWYVWERYPLQSVFYETLHRTGYYLKLGRKGATSWWELTRALRDTLLGIHNPLRHRKAISPGTLRYLRWVRRHGNNHGLAPEIRPFCLNWAEAG
jgi:GT2 family glycosyltransferase